MTKYCQDNRCNARNAFQRKMNFQILRQGFTWTPKTIKDLFSLSLKMSQLMMDTNFNVQYPAWDHPLKSLSTSLVTWMLSVESLLLNTYRVQPECISFCLVDIKFRISELPEFEHSNNSEFIMNMLMDPSKQIQLQARLQNHDRTFYIGYKN